MARLNNKKKAQINKQLWENARAIWYAYIYY